MYFPADALEAGLFRNICKRNASIQTLNIHAKIHELLWLYF